MAIVITVLAYFCVLLLFSHLTARKMASNETFYRANRRSPWYMVAFGMVGASISGITFVSVPGMVMRTDMTYLQMCIGFILGYFLVAFLLLPIYYRYNLTTIYGYLQQRLGERSYKTGASFFLLSKMTGAAVRFFVVCILLQRFVLDGIGVPFWGTVPVMVLLIWLYTRKGGIKTLVWTDTFQTLCMFAALILIICQVMSALGMTPSEAITAIAHDSHSRIFVFDDWMSKQNFWKQFLSGVFVVIVMTGLDQDMMQKNLTCKSLREAQKDVCSYGFAFVPANLLFLGLGGIGGCLEMMDTITNCTADVTIESENGGHAIGGLCGYAGTHSNPDVCLETEGFSTKNYPSVIDNCNVTVNIKANGATHVGGLVGTGLYYYGEETVFKITNCSVKGSIDGAVTPGTVAGRAEGSTIESCTADVTIDGNAGTEQVGTTTQMYESADQ